MDDMGPMPDECNGIGRKDESLDFDKWNCVWKKKAAGRHRIDQKKSNGHARPKKKKSPNGVYIKNPKSICLVLEYDMIEYIKTQAMHKSITEGKYVEPNELIREALQKAFPCPKQVDMFGDKNAR